MADEYPTPWKEVPPGSLCELKASGGRDARLFVRWPEPRSGVDSSWVPGHGDPTWAWRATGNATSGPVKVIASGLSADLCAAIAVRTAEEATELGRAIENALASATTLLWSEVPTRSAAIVVDAARSSDTGRLALRGMGNGGRYVDPTKLRPSDKFDWREEDRVQRVFVLAKSLTDVQIGHLVSIGEGPALRTLASWIEAGTVGKPKSAHAAAGPAVGEVIKWDRVTPGTYVQAMDDPRTEYVRWPETDADGDDVAELALGSSVDVPTNHHSYFERRVKSEQFRVIASGLDSDTCQAIAEHERPGERWAIASGRAVPIDLVPPGSVWFGRRSSGVTYSNSDTRGVPYDEDDDGAEWERGGSGPDSERVHVVLTGVTDEDLDRYADGTVDEFDLAEERWEPDDGEEWPTKGREWLADAVARATTDDIGAFDSAPAYSAISKAAQQLHLARSGDRVTLSFVGLRIWRVLHDDRWHWVGWWGGELTWETTTSKLLLGFLRDRRDPLAAARSVAGVYDEDYPGRIRVVKKAVDNSECEVRHFYGRVAAELLAHGSANDFSGVCSLTNNVIHLGRIQAMYAARGGHVTSGAWPVCVAPERAALVIWDLTPDPYNHAERFAAAAAALLAVIALIRGDDSHPVDVIDALTAT